jgi:hypothetical protein
VSVIATLQRIGHHDTVELIPGDPGSRTFLQIAEREGVLVRDHKGQLVDRPPPWAPPLPLRLLPDLPQEDRDRMAEAFGEDWDLA